MSKTYYSEYSRHCLRFYVRHANPVFTCDSDRKDWAAAEKAVNALRSGDREFAEAVYRSYGGEFIQRVTDIARKMNVPQKKAWKIIGDVEKDVARRRGLIC